MFDFSQLRNRKTAQELGKMFSERKVLKQYVAITKFIPKEVSGEIDIPLYRRQINQITKVIQFIN